MQEERKDEGLKDKGGDPSENQSGSENGQDAGDGVKDLKSDPLNNKPESDEDKADKLLDGTRIDKDIRVNKKRFDEKNEKAKLYETYAPLIEKVIQDPDLVENLLETKKKGDVESRLKAIEDEKKNEKRRELKSSITEAISKYPDFENCWPEIQEDVLAKIKRGIPAAEAIRREYIALNPDFAREESARIAQDGFNREGQFSGGGYSPRVNKINPNVNLSPTEKRIAEVLGKKPEEYAKILEKHKDWLNTNFREADGI